MPAARPGPRCRESSAQRLRHGHQQRDDREQQPELQRHLERATWGASHVHLAFLRGRAAPARQSRGQADVSCVRGRTAATPPGPPPRQDNRPREPPARGRAKRSQEPDESRELDRQPDEQHRQQHRVEWRSRAPGDACDDFAHRDRHSRASLRATSHRARERLQRPRKLRVHRRRDASRRRG